jgi:hypothetical protein
MSNLKINFIYQFSITILIVFIVSLTVYYNYFNWIARKENIVKAKNLNFLQLDNISTGEKKDYYNSFFYRDKLFKTEGLKRKNEVVIELNSEERQLEYNETGYTPKLNDEENTKYYLWIRCLFNENNTKTNLNNYHCR